MADFTRYPNQAGWTLAEHKQVSDVPTACPSNRIPFGILLSVLNEEGDMDTEVRSRLAVQALFLQAAAYAAEGKPLPKALADQIHYLLHA